MSDYRIGAACKWIDPLTHVQRPEFNMRTTTVKAQRQFQEENGKAAARARLFALVEHNIAAVERVLRSLAGRDHVLRMWRLGSDFLPLASHPVGESVYQHPSFAMFESRLAKLGEYARRHRIRLSFHPGQFVVLGSPNPHAREMAVRDVEYHAQVAWLMGYRSWHQDGFCINVHVGGKQVDPRVWLKTFRGLSQQARDLLTLENDEFCWGAREIIHHFGDHVPLVLDVHHYWIERHKYMRSEGKHIDMIRDTWRGVRPKMHLAMSFVDLIPEDMRRKALDLDTLLTTTNKAALRAHADAPWHAPTIDYWGEFVNNFDLMYEGKDKNLGAHVIAHHLGLI